MNETDIEFYFDKMSLNREAKFLADPILKYEQDMRQFAVVQLLNPKKQENILDVGCGNLRDYITLANKGAKVWGIDISLGMLIEGKKSYTPKELKNLRIFRASATHLPFRDGFFDKILCSEVLEHIPDYKQCIEEMARCLKLGGRIVLTTPNRKSLYMINRKIIEFINSLRKKRIWDHPYDEWKTEEELCSVLKKYNLKIENRIGICYLPGFSFSIILPKVFVKTIVKFIHSIEPRMRLKMYKWGYMIGISAKK